MKLQPAKQQSNYLIQGVFFAAERVVFFAAEIPALFSTEKVALFARIF